MFNFNDELEKFRPLAASDGAEDGELESESGDIVELLRYISKKIASEKDT